MGLHYTEEQFAVRVQMIATHFGREKINVWEGAMAFFEAAFGQRSSVIEEAFRSLPSQFHPALYEFIAEQEEIGYESKGGLVRQLFHDEKAEMEARLASARPLIRETCHELRRLLNEASEQAGAGQPATRLKSKSEGSQKPQPEAEGRSR